MAEIHETADLIMKEVNLVEDKLPEEEKTGIKGQIIAFIKACTTCTDAWSFVESIKDIKEMNNLEKHMEKVKNLLDNTACGGKEAILRAYDYLKQHCPKLQELFLKGVKKENIMKENILDAMKSFHKQQVQKMITSWAILSAVTAAIQFLKLFLVWNEVANASNVIPNPEKFASIEEKLKKMETMVTEFLDLCETTPDDVAGIELKYGDIGVEYDSIIGEIDDLKCKINEKIQPLRLLATSSKVDGYAHAANAVTGAYYLWRTWSVLTSPTVRVLSAVMVFAFTGLAFGSYKVTQLTHDKLKDLRKCLGEVNRVRAALVDLRRQTIKQRQKWRSEMAEEDVCLKERSKECKIITKNVCFLPPALN